MFLRDCILAVREWLEAISERVFSMQCECIGVCTERAPTLWQSTRSISGEAPGQFLSTVTMNFIFRWVSTYKICSIYADIVL
jgi:hypothetical protein